MPLVNVAYIEKAPNEKQFAPVTSEVFATVPCFRIGGYRTQYAAGRFCRVRQ
jgi:hypothetical protein